MNYQVGSLLNPELDDPHFDTESECYKYMHSKECKGIQTFGIWTGQNFGSELIIVVHDEEVFRK